MVSPCLSVLTSFHAGGTSSVSRLVWPRTNKPPALDNLGRSGSSKSCWAKELERRSDVFFAVGRIGKDQIELLTICRELADGGEGVLHANLERIGGEPRAFQIAGDERGVAAGFFHAQGARGPATEAFQTQCACAGE